MQYGPTLSCRADSLASDACSIRCTRPFTGAEAHDLPPLVYKYVDISVSAVKPDAPDLTAHPVYTYAHIARMRHQYDAVVLIQIKHGVFL